MKPIKKSQKLLNLIPQIIANAVIVLSAVYILFYILDGFNPMLHFLGDQVFLTKYLDIIIAVLALVLGVLFIVCTWKLYNMQGKKKKKKRLVPPAEEAAPEEPVSEE